MWKWIKGLWEDEDVAARALKSVAMGAAVYISTPVGRSEIERLIPAILAMLGSGIPSTKPRE